MSGIHFAEPQWVHLFWAVLAFTLLLIFLERRGGHLLSRFIGPALQGRLVNSTSTTRRILRILFLTLTGCFLVLALMRPQWGLTFVNTPRVGAEIMVALDVSRSMLAEDVTPNRLERAKAELRDLLAYLDGDQVGLIAFAGRASVVSPMTPDFGFLRIVLDQVGPNSVTRGGTRLEEPIRKAIAGFGEAGDISRSILLITDGEDHDSFPMEAAKAAAERGIRILAIGFGDENGSEIVLTDPKSGVRSTLRDTDGKPVKSRLDGDMLREMALETGGAYIPAGTGLLDLESIYEEHIVSLTRGLLDGRSRRIRNDAYQWAVLLGLLCLMAAVATTAGRGERPRPGGLHSIGWLTVPLLAASLIAASPSPAIAQQAQQTEPPPIEAVEEKNSPAAKPAAEDKEREEEKPFDPREGYNRALSELSAGRLDEAEELFKKVRSKAGNDGEARFRSSYNLGWVEVRRADAKLNSKPEESLAALHRAADRFREAIELRPNHKPSRHNLDLVLRRALELADNLDRQEEDDITAMLTKLIEDQRSFLGELREGVNLGELKEDPNRAEQSRRTFRSMASRQLELLSEAESLSRKAGQEVTALKSKGKEELQPKESMRIVQLDNLLHYLHRSRERMGQARGQMRRLQAERAYRRSSAALAELKRARDQLQNPVERLDALLADGTELIKLTGVKTALEMGGLKGEKGEQPPAWLTTPYLTESQGTLIERINELLLGFEAGLTRAQQKKGESDESPTPEQELLHRQLREVSPLIEESSRLFGEARFALEGEQFREALTKQDQALGKLADARERFLDLRRLVELLYQEQRRVFGLLEVTPEQDQQTVEEYLPTARELHARNVERSGRVRELLTRSLVEVMDKEEAAKQQPPATSSPPPQHGGAQQPQAPDPEALKAEHQRLDRADKLQVIVEQRMGEAQRRLEAAEIRLEEEDSGVVAVGTARGSVENALAAIEELRRLFFSVIEHLKETARQQMELNDESEEVRGLVETREPVETERALGPLIPRQESLIERSGGIGDALSRQAAHLAEQAKAAQTQPQQQQPQMHAGPDADKMLQAADHVAAAKEKMENAGDGMSGKPPKLEESREAQDKALEELLQAIALLEPPEQEQQNKEQQQQQNQEQQQDQGKDKEQQDQQKQQSQDQRQLLQGVRDREAKRREEKAKREQSSGYEPVEKDW